MPNALEWVIGVGQIGAVALAAWAAKSAAGSARSAQLSTEAQERPLLLDVPYEHYTDHSNHEMLLPGNQIRLTGVRGEIFFDPLHGSFAIPVRNVGRGLARIESFALSLTGEPDAAVLFRADVALPVGEATYLVGEPQPGSRFHERLAAVPSPLHYNGALTLEVTYTDYLNARQQRLEMRMGGRAQGTAWRVLHASHRASGSGQEGSVRAG
jgi:hypothetical protein